MNLLRVQCYLARKGGGRGGDELNFLALEEMMRKEAKKEGDGNRCNDPD